MNFCIAVKQEGYYITLVSKETDRKHTFVQKSFLYFDFSYSLSSHRTYICLQYATNSIM